MEYGGPTSAPPPPELVNVTGMFANPPFASRTLSDSLPVALPGAISIVTVPPAPDGVQFAGTHVAVATDDSHLGA